MSKNSRSDLISSTDATIRCVSGEEEPSQPQEGDLCFTLGFGRMIRHIWYNGVCLITGVELEEMFNDFLVEKGLPDDEPDEGEEPDDRWGL